MAETRTAASPTAPTPAAANLSHEIACTVERSPGDEVRCTQVTSDTYRCNWWAVETSATLDRSNMAGLMVTTHRVRMSQYLRVIRNAEGKLVIKPWSPSRPLDAVETA